MPLHPYPNISVVIFSYNFVKYIGECIESILAQHLKPFEIIICDDHSLDGSWEIIMRYWQRYPILIRPFRQKKNVGPARNGIFGQKKIQGDLYAWIDGDDRWLPQKLQKEWQALSTYPDAKLAYSNVYVIDANGHRTGLWYNGKGQSPPTGDVFVNVFAKRFFCNTHNVFRNPLVYSSALERVGLFDLNLDNYWDWDEKIRLTYKFPVVYSGHALVEYRLHKDGIHMQDAKIQIRAISRIFEKHLEKLKHRSECDQIRVRCSLESLMAKYQFQKSATNAGHHPSASLAYERNYNLLLNLAPNDRKVLIAELSESFLTLALIALREQIKKVNIKLAFKYFLEIFRYRIFSINIYFLIRVLIPRKITTWLINIRNLLFCTK